MEMLSNEERKELEQRCGFFEGPSSDLTDVCTEHLKLMTSKFIETTVSKNTCCLWPSHGSTLKLSRLSKGVETMVVTLELSKKIKENLDILVPVDGVLCKKHHTEVMGKMPSAPPQELMDATDSPASSALLSQGSNYQPDSQEKKTYSQEMKMKDVRLETLQSLLRQNFIEEEVKYVAETPYNDLEKTSRWKIMTNLGLAFFAVMKTLSKAGDYVQLWSAAKESDVFQQKFMAPPPYLDSLLNEIITSHNHATSRQERRQILSILPETYSFAFLQRFNKEQLKIEDLSESEDEDTGFQRVTPNVFWNPPLTKWKYRAAKLHAMENSRGFAPVIFEPKHTWHLSEEQFEAIFGEQCLFILKYKKMLTLSTLFLHCMVNLNSRFLFSVIYQVLSDKMSREKVRENSKS